MNENSAAKTPKTKKSKAVAAVSIAIPVMVAGLLIDDVVRKVKSRKPAQETPEN